MKAMAYRKEHRSHWFVTFPPVLGSSRYILSRDVALCMRRILSRNHEPQVSCDGPVFWSSPERDERKEQTGQRVGSSNIIIKEDGMGRNSTSVVSKVGECNPCTSYHIYTH